jgi:hypothetical protein
VSCNISLPHHSWLGLSKYFFSNLDFFFKGIHPISIAALSGILGAQSLLFAKAVALILLSLATGDRSVMSQLDTYLILLAMIFFVASQTHTLNASLQRFESVFVLPVFQVKQNIEMAILLH